MDLKIILNIYNICLFAFTFIVAAITGVIVCYLKVGYPGGYLVGMTQDGFLTCGSAGVLTNYFTMLALTFVCKFQLYHGNLRVLLLNVSVTHSFVVLLVFLTELLELLQVEGLSRTIINFLNDICKFVFW